MRAPPAATLAWSALLLVAGILTARAAAMWLGALVSGAPVLYGEGAVAHAGQILAAGGDPYAIEPAGTFVAANYPPLSFVVAALGEGAGPFVALRAASIVATLGFAFAIAWRAGSVLRGVALAFSWTALFPVEIWGAAAKPDPLAVSLAGLAVLSAGPSWRRAGTAGVLGALAVLAKPTAALPLLALAAWLAIAERTTFLRLAISGGGALAVGLVLVVLRSGIGGPFEHIVSRNALSFSVGAVAQLAVVGIFSLGVFVVVAAHTNDRRLGAYVLGALGVVLLGGREGATINYLLDLGAASAIAVAAGALALRPYVPVAFAAQLVVAALLFHPFDPAATTGAWRDAGRVAVVADLARGGTYLAEDSGILVAKGIDPQVDDLFLWSRLVARGAIPDDITPRVRDGSFAGVLSDVDLSSLDRAPAFERQRWSEPLAAAVLAVYQLERSDGGVYRYVRRSVR